VRATTPRLQLLDYLRLVAALSVMAYHYLYVSVASGDVTTLTASGAAPVARYGFLGVELFFLISGFVIANSARGKTVRRFLVGRAVRLYPSFWVAMVITTVVVLALGSTRDPITPGQFLVNLTMVPMQLGVEPIDGAYWTLAFELIFYVFVAVVMAVGLGRHLDRVFPIWALAQGAITLVAPHLADTTLLLGGYYAMFASGAIIASLREYGPSPLRIAGLLVSYVVAVRFVVGNVPTWADYSTTDYSPLLVGLLVTVAYLLVLSMCVPAVAGLRLRGAALAGALTYPVYLLHDRIGFAVFEAYADDANRWFVYPATALAVIALAWALHELVEVRLRGLSTRLFDLPFALAERLRRRLPTRAVPEPPTLTT
jgi:peptidoglycan/LPS O-acetylase OafA/YrhL